jgi:hypothetical protein
MNWTPTMTQGSLKHYSVEIIKRKKFQINFTYLLWLIESFVTVMYSGG